MSLFLRLVVVVAMLQVVVPVPVATAAADVVAIVPDRNSFFRNDFHNALRTSAAQFHVSLEIRDMGDYDKDRYDQLLVQATNHNSQEQPPPKVVLFWPPEQTPHTAQRLHALKQAHPDTHLLQFFQYPNDDHDHAWQDYLTAYFGNDEAYQGRLCADMVLQALIEEHQQNYNNEDNDNQQDSMVVVRRVAVLGFRQGYAKGVRVAASFEARLIEQQETMVQEHQIRVQLGQVTFPPAFGEQSAYDTLLGMVHEHRGQVQSMSSNASTEEEPFAHVLFCMDDMILTGAYQALQDLHMDHQVTLVGTACNGARDLITNGQQWGTTLLSPVLAGQGAMALAVDLMQQPPNNRTNTTTTIRYVPETPIYHGQGWQDQLVQDGAQLYTVDQLCTWKHTYTRVAGISDVDQVPGFPNTDRLLCDVVTCKRIPDVLYTVGYALTGLIYGLVVGSAVLLYVYRHQAVIQLAQPVFLGLVLLGTVVDTTSIVFMSITSPAATKAQLDAACVAWPWLWCIGHMMTTATLVAKMQRVKQVCMPAGQGGFRKVKVRWRQAVVLLLGLVAVDVVLLGIWYGLNPLQWHVSAFSYDTAGYISEVHGQCSFADSTNVPWLFPTLLLAWHLGVLLYAHWLMYQTRHFHKLSDSRNVAIALFNSLQLLIIAISLMLGGSSDEASYMIRILFVFMNNFWVLVLVILVKLWACMRGKGNELPDFHEMQLKESRRRSQQQQQQSVGNGLVGAISDFGSSFFGSPRAQGGSRRSPITPETAAGEGGSSGLNNVIERRSSSSKDGDAQSEDCLVSPQMQDE